VIFSSSLDIVILGLTVTSSWGNGHATTYRGLIRELVARGHQVLFLERDMPWYSSNRDLAVSSFGQSQLYRSVEELKQRFTDVIKSADVVIVGSSVMMGPAAAYRRANALPERFLSIWADARRARRFGARVSCT
jgi:hypothetical protein